MTTNKTNLVSTIEKITKDIEELKTQKCDTSNLKNSYTNFVTDQTAENGKRQVHVNTLEAVLNNLILKVDEAIKKLNAIENIQF